MFQTPGQSTSSEKILLTQKYCASYINHKTAYLALSALLTINIHLFQIA